MTRNDLGNMTEIQPVLIVRAQCGHGFWILWLNGYLLANRLDEFICQFFGCSHQDGPVEEIEL